MTSPAAPQTAAAPVPAPAAPTADASPAPVAQPATEQAASWADRVAAAVTEANAEPAAPAEPAAEQSPQPEPQQPQESASERWARLKMLEKENRELRHQAKQREPQQDLRELAKSDKRKALEAIGVTEADLWQILAGGTTVDDTAAEAPAAVPDALQRRIDALEAELREFKTGAQDQQFQAQLAAHVAGVQQIVGADQTRWSAINALGDYQGVVATAAEWYQRTGETPTPQDAADAYEELLRETKRSEYDKLHRIYGAPSAQPVKPAPTAAPRTTALTASGVDSPPGWENLSFQDRIAALRKELDGR